MSDDILPTITQEVQPVGIMELRAKYESMTEKVQKTIARESMKPGAELIRLAMVSRIHSRTGLLAKGTKLRVAKGDVPGRVALLVSAVASASVVAKHLAMAGRSSQAVALLKRHRKDYKYRIFYSRMVEYGHAGPKNSAARTPAHSFARAGFDAVQDQAGDLIVESLGENIQIAYNSD